MRIAFTAPMKPPDHPVPSGDRAMARALISALEAGRNDVVLVSRLRSWCAEPNPDAISAVEAAAHREVERLAAAWAPDGAPDLWFTYHSYYRAPDLVGPALSARFGLPYVVAEASQAGKRAGGPWMRWHEANARAIRAASVHVCFTDRDAAGLAALVAPERIVRLPPFLASTPAPPEHIERRAATASPPASEAPIRLVTAAMMRPAKVRSYAILAEALAAIADALPWRLAIAGDGPERAKVEALFAALPPGRIAWLGALAADGVAALFASADLFVWPGFREPFGVAYLEAQAAGLPVLAMESGGVASVVENGRTGLLVPEGNGPAFAAALGQLIGDAALRHRLGREGRRMVREERTVARAAEILNDALARACAVAA